jgi:twitching motility protein PilT
MSELIRDPELDRLVEQLNQDAPAPPGDIAGEEDGDGTTSEWPQDAGLPPFLGSPDLPGAGASEPPRLLAVDEGDPLARLLAEMGRLGASDLLLLPELAPILRLDGRLQATANPPVTENDIRLMFAPYLGGRARRQLEEQGSADFSLRLGGSGATAYRYRVNVHRQRGRLAAALRALPREVPTLGKLNLPKSLAKLVQPTRGLVLVCGPTGSGKTSTLAALVGEINRNRAAHVITIEDPVEYEHDNARSIVEQVEVGIDSPSFAAALRSALRQDPDVILVGEMRDLETVATALTAAETGHLILSTLHTSDVVQAVHRVVDVFPAGQQAQIRQQLALSLNAILFQQLVPRADGSGRVPAVELLLATHPVRHHIRSQSLQKLYTEITLGKSAGMISFEDSLAALVRQGAIDLDEARVRSARPDELESLLRA